MQLAVHLVNALGYISDVNAQLVSQHRQLCADLLYVETGDFNSYTEEVRTKLSVLTDQLSIDITRITERIDDVNGDLQSKYSEITKAFRFTSDGLIIGETGNEILLRLDNDVLQFVRNNTPELQITAEGVEAMRIKVSILCIGNVVWTEDENGDVIAS